MVAWLLAHGFEVVGYVISVLSGIIGISLLIPGDQPEKALQKVVDFLSSISRK